jgi:GDP-4-dehydro-6-deoxy-D-mannose reductase
MKLLVTGASGFAGRNLLKLLQSQDPKPALYGWHRGQIETGQYPGINWSQVDLIDADAVERAIARTRPTHLIHLAAASNVGSSFRTPALTWEINAIGTLNLMESLWRSSPETRVVMISSAAVYGQAFAAGRAVDEDAVPLPLDPYGASKLACEILAGVYLRRGLHVLILRPFNYLGAGQIGNLVIPTFTQQLARIKCEQSPPRLLVGNLETTRDFLHIRDVVRAYWDVLRFCDDIPSGTVMNVSSGIPRKIADILADLIRLSALHQVEVNTDTARLRPSDIPVAIGDASKLHRLTGWEPLMDWEETLEECLTDARKRLANQGAG